MEPNLVWDGGRTEQPTDISKYTGQCSSRVGRAVRREHFHSFFVRNCLYSAGCPLMSNRLRSALHSDIHRAKKGLRRAAEPHSRRSTGMGRDWPVNSPYRRRQRRLPVNSSLQFMFSLAVTVWPSFHGCPQTLGVELPHDEITIHAVDIIASVILDFIIHLFEHAEKALLVSRAS
jgi:hypothetical protein